ncbi:transposase [Streptomyces kebangsaanensis]|uniref:Transposase n=1 Tax=Streptomyces kebangsaanensis TaxID=864058 RepID=A0ABW6KZA0_9ACTN
MRRHELTDAQWQRIGPLLPAHGKPGGQWADHRKVINGVLFRARTCVPWPGCRSRPTPPTPTVNWPRPLRGRAGSALGSGR